MEKQIFNLLKEKGPLPGAGLLETLGKDALLLWRACKLSKSLILHTVGRRYLRLDSKIEGFARLSPSILREFLTYCVLGLRQDRDLVIQKAREIDSHIIEVSAAKLDLANRIVSAVIGRLENEALIQNQVCIVIAGDIVYKMAHDVPRRERSTGKWVKGSDMDLVIVVEDAFPRKLMEKMDEFIYREKQKILMAPHLREEIDYVVKDFSRVREQMEFDTFKRMVACKILQEGTLLYGSKALFNRLKAMLQERGITKRLAAMEHEAAIRRKQEEEYLLREDPDKIRKQGLSLFYPADESEEFE